MGFFPFLTQAQQLAGATIPGTLAVTGILSTQGITNTTTQITSSAIINTTGLVAIASSGNVNAALGSVDIQSAGNGLKVAEGSGTNAKQGTFTLAGAATTVVANTSVTANSRILLTTQTLGTVTAASTLAISARTAGTSFTVTPSQATDTSVVAFEIFEPG